MQEITVYTTDICPFCVQVKRLLDSQSIPYKEVNLEDNRELRQKLSAENGGWRTVPMVFFGEKFIGGFMEVRALHQNGTLMDSLA